jgi:hypothetical protein
MVHQADLALGEARWNLVCVLADIRYPISALSRNCLALFDLQFPEPDPGLCAPTSRRSFGFTLFSATMASGWSSSRWARCLR